MELYILKTLENINKQKIFIKKLIMLTFLMQSWMLLRNKKKYLNGF